MEFNYSYYGASTVSSGVGSTAMSFAPDTTREPTFFKGRLGRGLAFREAISAMHDVVVSDLRYQHKDRTEYMAWLARQELVDMAEVASSRADVRSRIDAVNRDLNAVNQAIYAKTRTYNQAISSYFQYLLRRDYQAWIILDPVITVHPDELFFECFSQDESTYARLGVDYSVFGEVGEFSCGTTNIDYSTALYNEFQKIRSYKDTRFEIDPSGFGVTTGDDDAYKEVKIDLPDSWVRGFLQVSSAMSLPMTSFDLTPTDVHNICFALRRRREKRGPRSLRYILKPGQPVRVVVEPWNQELVCARSIYTGAEETEIRVWGRRRLHTLERLLPVSRRITVHLLGSGLPSFYVADMGLMSFTLGLSGWTTNDWSRAGNFDLMAPRADVDHLTKRQVFHALKENWAEDIDALAGRLRLERATVLGALGAWTQAGRAIYDLNKGVWRARELSREPLPLDKLRFSNEREESASKLVDANRVKVEVSQVTPERGLILRGTVRDGHQTHRPMLLIDADERMVEAECDCFWYGSNKLYKGPCTHMLALRIDHARRRTSTRPGGRR